VIDGSDKCLDREGGLLELGEGSFIVNGQNSWLNFDLRRWFGGAREEVEFLRDFKVRPSQWFDRT